MKHSDYITHINNEEDLVYLKSKHFPVNMRLFRTSQQYKDIILQQCQYINDLCLAKADGYKLPHGMSSANVGLAFNIIGIAFNRGTDKARCLIMINPEITYYSKEKTVTSSNCGSLTLKEPINIQRSTEIRVSYYQIDGSFMKNVKFIRETGAFTIQHEVDHNLGILITDYLTLKKEQIHSDSQFACPDYCIYDAGTNCLNCDRFENTLYNKLKIKYE